MTAVCLVLALAWLSACSQREGDRVPRSLKEIPGVESQYGDSIVRARRSKDEGFRTAANSPLPPEERARFQGLAYFPLNSGLRFRVQLVRYPHPERLQLGTNTGEIRDALRYGYFEFETAGKRCRLQVYRTMEDIQAGGHQLFLPFRDATSGKETYGAGRYIDLRENTSGVYELDFNEAYNPYCAYSKTFSCPVPPAENTLPVPIEAGEKTYVSH